MSGTHAARCDGTNHICVLSHPNTPYNDNPRFSGKYRAYCKDCGFSTPPFDRSEMALRWWHLLTQFLGKVEWDTVRQTDAVDCVLTVYQHKRGHGPYDTPRKVNENAAKYDDA